jgi:cytochrome b561
MMNLTSTKYGVLFRSKVLFTSSKRISFRGLAKKPNKYQFEPLEKYSMPMRIMHWTMAIVMGGVLLTAPPFQTRLKKETSTTNDDDDDEKSLMFWHKSFGVLASILLPLRLILRFTSELPYPLSPPFVSTTTVSPTEFSMVYDNRTIMRHMMMEITNITLRFGVYGFMTLTAITGIIMGYYSEGGFPFFFTTFKGTNSPNTTITTKMIWWHSIFGYYGKFLIPLHVGGVFTHQFGLRQPVLVRMNPFVG